MILRALFVAFFSLFLSLSVSAQTLRLVPEPLRDRCETIDTITRGGSFYQLVNKHYGNTVPWPKFLKHNPHLAPQYARVFAGDEVCVPSIRDQFTNGLPPAFEREVGRRTSEEVERTGQQAVADATVGLLTRQNELMQRIALLERELETARAKAVTAAEQTAAVFESSKATEDERDLWHGLAILVVIAFMVIVVILARSRRKHYARGERLAMACADRDAAVADLSGHVDAEERLRSEIEEIRGELARARDERDALQFGRDELQGLLEQANTDLNNRSAMVQGLMRRLNLPENTTQQEAYQLQIELDAALVQNASFSAANADLERRVEALEGELRVAREAFASEHDRRGDLHSALEHHFGGDRGRAGDSIELLADVLVALKERPELEHIIRASIARPDHTGESDQIAELAQQVRSRRMMIGSVNRIDEIERLDSWIAALDAAITGPMSVKSAEIARIENEARARLSEIAPAEGDSQRKYRGEIKFLQALLDSLEDQSRGERAEGAA